MKNKKKMEIFKIKMIIKYIINYDILVKKFSLMIKRTFELTLIDGKK